MLITDYFKKIITWRCLECGIDMGPQNPRQLCGKIRCLFRPAGILNWY